MASLYPLPLDFQWEDGCLGLISFLQERFTVEIAISTLTLSTSQDTRGMYMEQIIMSSAQCVRRFSRMIRLAKSIYELYIMYIGPNNE